MENGNLNKYDAVKVPITTVVNLNLKSMFDTIPGLSYAEALEFGIKFKLAEQDLSDFPDNKLLRNIAKLNGYIQELNQQIELLTQHGNETKRNDNADGPRLG